MTNRIGYRLFVGGTAAAVTVGIVALPAAQAAIPAEADSVAATPAANVGAANYAVQGKKTKLKGKVKGGNRMTVVALQSDGTSKTKRLKSNGKFKIKATSGATLQLVDSDGSYYGPIVLAGNKKKLKKSKKVYSQTKGSKTVNLGKITKKGGYGAVADKVGKKLAKKGQVQKGSTYAKAKKGKPVGAGKNGMVSVAKKNLIKNRNFGAFATSVAPKDLDRDGIPAAFDVDDDGDKIIDNVDRQDATGVNPGNGIANTGFRMFSNYKATSNNFSDVINVNVDTPSSGDLDASVNSKTTLAIQVIPGAKLFCTGQVYCPSSPMAITAGNTGDFQWTVSDTYASLGAGDINAGDTFVETAAGVQYPGVLNFVFLTTPALKSYTIIDEDGNQTGTTTVDWDSGNKAGSADNPIDVDVTNGETVKLTFWRPQRQAMSGEANFKGYVDLGGLKYLADAQSGFCNATAGDSEGTTVQETNNATAVRDTAADRVPAAGRTLSMVVDLDGCTLFGNDDNLDIQAMSEYGDNSAQKIYFNRVSQEEEEEDQP